jgi:thioredoxin reductase (NADPH)
MSSTAAAATSNAVENLIIIGSGPAGWTAAIYAARANLKPLLFEGEQPGGQLTITTEVENYPGFPHGVMGPELMEHFAAQARHFETRVLSETITSVDFSQRPFKVSTGKKDYFAHAVILSSGASAKWLNIPGEEKATTGSTDKYGGRGVSACATCDGFFFKGKHVAVVGGGDTAMEEANFLTKMCAKVTVIHRREEFKASKIMLDRARANPKIEWKLNAAPVAVYGDGKVMQGLKLKDMRTGEVNDFPVTALFVAIGHQPNTAFLNGQLKTDATGYVVTTPGSTRTSVEGVFACGDVQDSIYRQAVTAAGTGCMAAIDAERWLAANGQH